MAEIREVYHSFVKAFIDSISAFSMYPEKHPLVESALSNLISILENIFKLENKDLEITVKGRNLLVNDMVLDISKTFVMNLLSYMIKLELGNFSLRRSCTKSDVVDLIAFFAENARKQGNMARMLGSAGTEVFSSVSQHKEPAASSAAHASKDISHEILEKLFRSGEEALEGFIAFDEAELVEFIRRNPEKTVDLMVEAATYTGSIHLVWQRLGDWLIKAIRKVGFRLENIKFSNLISALGEILSARMRLIYSEKDASENLSLLFVSVSEYKNKLKVMEIASRISQEKELDFSRIAELSIETFESQEEKEQLLPLIKNELRNRGWDENKTEEVSNYIRSAFIPVRPKEMSGFSSPSLAGDKMALIKETDKGQGGEDSVLLEDMKKSCRILEKKHQRLDRILRKLGEGMLVVDSNNSIILANKKAEDILGASLDDLKGQAVDKVLKNEHLALLVQRSEESSLEEAVFIASDKTTEESVNSSWAIIEDENGDALGLLCILPDIGKIKELERIKSELIANVYDRLLKPLTASLDMTRVLLEEVSGPLTEEQKRILGDMHNNLEYIKDDLTNILKLSELRKSTEFSTDRINIVELLKEVYAFFQVIFAKKNISLKLKIDTRNKFVMANYQKTKDVLKEILTNSLKASSSGGSVLLICEDEFDAKGNATPFVKIRVRDKGKGIAKEDMPYLSDDFFAKGDKGFRGLGLGLSIVKEIVEKQGGILHIDSSLGRGAEVSFTVPKSK